nr:MAG TPA: hypothetical protein [Caudoviricetes sp.]
MKPPTLFVGGRHFLTHLYNRIQYCTLIKIDFRLMFGGD